MLLKIFTLTCLFLINFFIQPTICAVPNDIQNLELDDVTSLWDKFPSLIDKIKEAVSRFRCPKGWKRLGGSCYYFSNLTSISSHVNHSCNHLHSNLSNLMQIRNAVELFYAAHVLSRNNLSSLMIEIDPSLLKGKKISDMLMKDQGQWKRMKEKFHEVRVKYQKLKQKIVDRLSAAGLRILRRSKKLKPIPPKQEFIHDEIDFYQSDEYEYDQRELNITNHNLPNNTTVNISSIINNDEYEYDDLDSSDESDEFDQIENIRGFCDEIHWNVLNNTNNSTVYILTKYNISNKSVCSLSDVEPQTKYPHVCEYVLDFCFANIVCGKHGVCVNTLAGFKCSCSFLYGGLLCEKITQHGYQIIISIVFICILLLLSIKTVRVVLWFLVKRIINCIKRYRKTRNQKKVNINDDAQNSVTTDGPDNDNKIIQTSHRQSRRQTNAEAIMKFLREICEGITFPNVSNPLLSPVKRNLVRNIWVGVLSVILLTLLFVITTIMYYLSFGYNLTNDDENFSINETIRLVTDCTRISDYRRGNLIFAPCACALILLFSWSVKRETVCLTMCDGRPGLIPPIEPFHTGNRFTTATVFGILAFEVLKVFEELLFSTGQPLEHGVLVELLQRIALIIVVGLRYYPVLASLQLRNIVARFFACLYIICNIVYTIVREGSCMGFLPLSGKYTAVEEAKLRRELGTWFIVYGLIKNIPHFFFLSYIGAELCVRFAYDAIYVPRKKNQSIWLAPIVQLDESEFAKYYVTKLFRRNHHSAQTYTRRNNTNTDDVDDYEHEVELQNNAKPSCFQRFINYFYHFDDDFRFTTMAMCTYTVAVVFLYYLACTFVFLYVSRTTGHAAFLKFYFESTFDVDLGAFSLKTEIIVSAIFTAIIYAGQLFIGMQNYKKHKLQLYKGICVDIPSAENFDASSIASNSVHYSGFLVGYMAWGFVICFHLILLIFIGIRLLSLQIRHIELVLSIVVPILIIYLLKMLTMTSAGKFLFIPKVDGKLNLRSRKTYAVFVYFSFFADCFLGIASCIIRLIKATCLNIVYMARLDSSFMGRPLEKFDRGFAAYASYLHMEVTYTNPVMLAFCYSLYDDIIQRRPKRCYADECCIAPGELDDENDTEAPRQNQGQENRTIVSQNKPKVIYRRTDNNDPNQEESRSKRTSQIEIELHPQELPTIENTSETDSQNLSTISTKEKPDKINRKMKQQQSNIANQGKQNTSSTTTRNIPQQKPVFSPGPEIPRREDLSSEQDGIDDDDEGLKPKSFSTVQKLIPKPQPSLKSSTQSSKINTDKQTDEDEDRSISKRNESTKKKNLKKRKKGSFKSNISQEEDNDSARTGSSHGTIKKIIPFEQRTLDSRKAKDESSSDGDIKSLKQQKDRALTSLDTVDRKALQTSDSIRSTKFKKTTDKNHYDTVLIEDEHTTEISTSYSPPSYNLATNPNDVYPLETISHRQGQQSTPPPIPHRSYIPSVQQNQNNTNDDSSHYSEITIATTRSSVSNRSYSKSVLKEASSSHSNKQRMLEEQKQDDDDTNVETEEEEEKEEKTHLLKSELKSVAIRAIDNSTKDAPKSEEDIERDRIKKRKRLRFRWHFLYTLLRNYHLLDLTKDLQSRLIRLQLQRSNLVDEQQFAATTVVEVPKTAKRATGSPILAPERHFERSLSDIPTSINQRPSPPHRFLSVPASISSDLPQSPAERYIGMRAQMLYDVNNQQPSTPYSPSTARTPITTSAYKEQLRFPITTTASGQSLGFHVSSDIAVNPPSERRMKSGGKQPSIYSTPQALLPESIKSPAFQPVSASNQSTAGYPLTGTSIINSSTYGTQMSHDQQMQAWHQSQVKKIQKKQRRSYVYDTPATPSAASVILTPQNISAIPKQYQVPTTLNDGKTQRGPTPSPFQFRLPSSQVRSASSSIISDTQSKTKNPKLKINRPQQGIPIPPQRMDRLDEDPQETSNGNKSSKVTSALIHREDSQSSVTDITET